MTLRTRTMIAQRLRRNATDVECILWNALRTRDAARSVELARYGFALSGVWNAEVLGMSMLCFKWCLMGWALPHLTPALSAPIGGGEGEQYGGAICERVALWADKVQRSSATPPECC